MDVELQVYFNEVRWNVEFEKDGYGNNRLLLTCANKKPIEASGIIDISLGWNEVLLNNQGPNQGLYESLFHGNIIRKNPSKEMSCGFYYQGVYKLTPVATKLLMQQLNSHIEEQKGA